MQTRYALVRKGDDVPPVPPHDGESPEWTEDPQFPELDDDDPQRGVEAFWASWTLWSVIRISGHWCGPFEIAPLNRIGLPPG